MTIDKCTFIDSKQEEPYCVSEKTINWCACLGPKQDEPYCMCEMINHGLKTKQDYEMSDTEKDAFYETLAKAFDWKEKGAT